MSTVSTPYDLSGIEIAMDAWTEPVWRAAEEGRLLVPRCGDCSRFRWPPGPFCPHCRSQSVEWMPAGPGRLFSYTIVRGKPAAEGDSPLLHVPAVIEFPEAGNMRILAPLVGAREEELSIDAPVEVVWLDAANTRIAAFRLARQ